MLGVGIGALLGNWMTKPPFVWVVAFSSSFRETTFPSRNLVGGEANLSEFHSLTIARMSGSALVAFSSDLAGLSVGFGSSQIKAVSPVRVAKIIPTARVRGSTMGPPQQAGGAEMGLQKRFG